VTRGYTQQGLKGIRGNEMIINPGRKGKCAEQDGREKLSAQILGISFLNLEARI